MERRHKDAPLLIKATERLIGRNKSLKSLSKKYTLHHSELTNKMKKGEILRIEYYNKNCEIVKDFVREVSSLIL